LTVEWGNPEEALDVFIRKDFAPVDIASLPPLNGEEAFANETFDEPDPISGATPTNPALASSPEWKAVHGWEGAKGVSSCGSFGDILGGSNLFGYGTKISKSFYVPKPHTSVRVRLDIIKIDLWDSETASFFLDGVRICDQIDLWDGKTASASVMKIDLWDGESVSVFLDGVRIWCWVG
ncbi:hypothetical protein T484DRAFT_1794967, partial [Baffinella frigidus]